MGVILGSVSLQLIIIYNPAMNALFATKPLSLTELLICIAISLIMLVAAEIEKGWVRRKKAVPDSIHTP